MNESSEKPQDKQSLNSNVITEGVDDKVAKKTLKSLNEQPLRNPKNSKTKAKTKQKNDKPTSAKSMILVIVMAIALAFLLVTYVFHSYQVDGSSMEPNLQNGNRLIVWKLPRTIARITGNDYLPNRGDVIVFEQKGLSGYSQPDDAKQLVKRVIGLPGDRVKVKDGTVTIYNNSHPDGFNPDKTLSYGYNIEETSGNIDTTIGPDQLFVMGDNRPDSLDSRIFGPINANQIIGKLVLRVTPLSQITKF